METTNKNQGGYAFANERETGMTLRDYFAGQALPSMISSSMMKLMEMNMSGPDIAKHLSEAAYEFADAMLKEREE